MRIEESTIILESLQTILKLLQYLVDDETAKQRAIYVSGRIEDLLDDLLDRS